MYTIKFKREHNYKQNLYCILQFKGKFETDSFDPQNQQKSLIHLGQLKRIDQNKYKLQIGVMDLVGKQQKLNSTQIVTQTIICQQTNTKTILVKGIIVKKVVFQGRPAPDMERVVNTKRDSVNYKMFSKMQEKQQISQRLSEKQSKQK